MSIKKKLITRMALWTGAILAVALMVGGVGLALLHDDQERWEDGQKREREQVVERSRKYLGELAKKVDKLPVNPTLVGEIEARYFEERTGGSVHVWAMGTDGAFLFGVPKESFSRLNAVYDREITPRLKEGVFFDRQAFLLGHLDEARQASALALALGRLPDFMREVVVLRCSRELTFAEIAEVTGAPEGTLKSRFHRAVAALREALGPERGKAR